MHSYLPAFCLSVRIIAQSFLVLQIVQIRPSFQSYWPVYKVEIQIVQLQVLESGLTSWENSIFFMLIAPA
jgi:hypothetical protein